jgi:metal-responsive CopG/Arc/MetJ family transcriptional regulator
MSMTEDLVVNLPTQTADRLRALVLVRGPGSEGQIITDALAALIDEAEENQKLKAMISAGFESDVWHEASDVRVSLQHRYQA